MILAVDIGTTSVKAALFDRKGDCFALDSRAVDPIASPDPVAHEVRAESWTEGLAALVPALIHAAHDNIARPAGSVGPIECIVVSGNGPTLVPVDAAGKPLAPAVTWMDRRAVEEAAMAGKAAGRFLDPTYNLPKALRFMRRRPDIYERTAHFSSCPEYVCGSLTGEWRSFLPAEGFQPIIWDDASIRALGLDAAKFPPFIRLGKVVGKVTARASEAFGLPEGIPVVSGGPDFVVSLIGTATTRPGRACDRAGTSEGINLCHAGSFPDDTRLLVMPHVIEPHLNVSGVISTSGKAVSWFRKASGDIAGDYEGFFEEVCQVEPGAGRLLFLPYLSGERAPLWDPDARGSFVGLTLNHGRAQMARAVVESTAFAMRDVIDTMESLGGHVSEMRVTGNPARNPVWNQIKADITGRPLEVPRFPHAELMGDLCLALTALGEYPDPAAAAESLVVVERVHEPDISLRALYDNLFGLYRESYRSLKHVFAGLAGPGADGRAG
ncbi:MAG: FGGY-family carbohydrate kinase [Rectinema sp.]